jgi:hypothetical protein
MESCNASQKCPGIWECPDFSGSYLGPAPPNITFAENAHSLTSFISTLLPTADAYRLSVRRLGSG